MATNASLEGQLAGRAADSEAHHAAKQELQQHVVQLQAQLAEQASWQVCDLTLDRRMGAYVHAGQAAVQRCISTMRYCVSGSLGAYHVNKVHACMCVAARFGNDLQQHEHGICMSEEGVWHLCMHMDMLWIQHCGKHEQSATCVAAIVTSAPHLHAAGQHARSS